MNCFIGLMNMEQTPTNQTRGKAQRVWTTKELAFLYKCHQQMSVSQIASHLNRSVSSIRNQFRHLKLKPKHERYLIDYAYYKGEELIYLGKIHEIAAATGTPEKTLFAYQYKSTMKKSHRRLIRLIDE